MSAFNETIGDYLVNIGYDRMLDYVFMVIYDKDQNMVYDNVELPNMFDIKDIEYFVKIAKERFSIEIPENVILDIKTESHFKTHIHYLPEDKVTLYQYELKNLK